MPFLIPISGGRAARLLGAGLLGLSTWLLSAPAGAEDFLEPDQAFRLSGRAAGVANN